jgi:nucleoside-diphosphate-sugar epimerase
MKRVLVTGASGFLGKPCVPLLIALGYEVHLVSSRAADVPSDKANDNLIWHQTDLLNEEANIAKLISQIRPTHLLHLAWCRTLPGKYGNDADNLRWVESSITLFREFVQSGGQRIVVAGTCMEYDWSYGFCSETNTPLKPASVYGTCKQSLQLLLHAFALKTGISAAWGRVFFLYGPQEYPERLVASVIRSLLKGEKALCSDGQQLRDFLYIDDAAAAFISLLESDIDGAVNVGSGKPIAVKEVAYKIGDILGRRDLIRLGSLPSRPNEPPMLVADVRRLQSTNWQANIDLENGLERTIEWWKKETNF